LLATLAGRDYDRTPQQSAAALGCHGIGRMEERAKTKPQAEKIVARKLRRHLSPFTGAARRTDSLIYRLLEPRERHPTNDKAPVACAILLARLGNDIRSTVLLASRGHVLQSWTVASAALESAYNVGYIGANEERAAKWFDHANVAKHPWPVFDTLRALLKPLGLAEYEQRFFGYYRQLSAAKHGNPLIQSRYGVTRGEESTRIQLDPYYSPNIVRAARHGILWPLHAAGLAMWSYTNNYPIARQMGNQVARFAQHTHELLAKARDVDV
jgi:hypothetical protein